MPNFYDYQPESEDSSAVEWHVNFADPRLFAAYGSGLFAQDEIRVPNIGCCLAFGAIDTWGYRSSDIPT